MAALLISHTTWMYYRSMDVSGPGQRAYARSDDIKLKLERLEVDERTLDIVHYGYLPSAAFLLGLSAFVIWAYRNAATNSQAE